MLEHLYLYDLKSEKPIHIYQNKTKEITEEIQSTFEKLLKEAIEDNTTQNINSNNQINNINIFSKFHTLSGSYFNCSTQHIFASAFTSDKNNEKIFQDLLNDICSDHNFLKNSNSPEKINALLNVYLNKYFSKSNPEIETNMLSIKDENKNNKDDQNISFNNSKKKMYSKPKKTIYVADALETQIEDMNKVELPNNYTKNKKCKLFLILLFVFIGIGLTIILPFVI